MNIIYIHSSLFFVSNNYLLFQWLHRPTMRINKVSSYNFQRGFSSLFLACSPTDHPTSLASPPFLFPQLCSPPLHGSLTFDLHPSPSLCALITGLSVKHQRPSSPAGLCCQTGLRYRQQQRKTERGEKWRNIVSLEEKRKEGRDIT